MTETTARQSSVTPKRVFNVLAIAETITWTLLIGGMVLKYAAHIEQAVLPVGIIHGFTFVSYGATTIIVGLNQRWPIGRILFAILTAVIPYATIPFERWLERRQLLEGGWRTEATDDPRDAGVVDRMLRWALRHPVMLVALVVIAIAVVFTVLLTLGPPTEWGQ